jgi:E3 ubiquitin-protein ligase AIP2
VRAIEACRDAVGGRDREALVTALSALAETREAAARADETKTETKTNDATLDEDVEVVTNEALRLILAARRRAVEMGMVAGGLERDFEESVRVGVSRASASAVSVEALRYRKPHDEEIGLKCSICFDCYVKDEVVVAMPCSASHVFHERCVKEWLTRDDSCPLCRSSLPVWLGRPHYA